jgi:hypothetical protein
MHKNTPSIDTYHISKEEYQALCKQPAAPMVVEAVKHYNEMVSEHFEAKDVNVLVAKEAEEEETKVFLDEILDLAEQKK